MDLYQPLRVVVLFLLLFHQIFGAQITCSTDADCSNGQGKCIFIGPTSYCSCLSGFGGNDCSQRPDPSCSFGIPETFDTNTSIVLSNENLTLSIATNLEHSELTLGKQKNKFSGPYSEELTITFGDGSFPDCNYPNSNDLDWLDHPSESGDCKDRYSLSLRFSDAKTKCGFADKNGNRVFEQMVHVNRKYRVSDATGKRVSKTETSSKKIAVRYPKTVKHTSVTKSGSPSLLSAITFVDFNPSSTPEKWTVEATTSVQAPFKLSNPKVISTSGQIASYNRFIENSESLSLVYGCANNTDDCFQKITLQFAEGTAANACEGLNGDVTVRMNLTCSDGLLSDGCLLEGGETVQAVLSLSTSDACPVTEQITFSTTSLNSFSNSGLSSSRTSFITNQKAYFGAVVQSNGAFITGRQIKNNSVCFQIESDPCRPVVYDILSPTNGKNPVFSVDFALPDNSNVFGFLNSSASAQVFSVHAVVEVDFSDTTKASHQFSDIQETQLLLTTSVKLIPASLEYSCASFGIPSVLLLTTLLLILVLIV